MENQSAQAPAGWYSDPAGSGGFRYWDGSEWSDNFVSKIPQQRRHWYVYGGSIIAGILIALSPLIMAYDCSLRTGASMTDESEACGAALWGLMLTAPLGAVVAVVGSIVGGILQSRAKSKSG